MFDKFFGWGKKREEVRPLIQFGRYSDNNKSVEKTNLWSEAETLFKEKKYHESLQTFFNYLKDDEINNVSFQTTGSHFKFEIYQGSKIVRGSGNAKHLHAKVVLAKMQQPSVPVMRRLLEQNFSLFYSRYSLNNDKLFMQFDSDIVTANPNKLYYALKELAIMSDKQDDLLVQDFKMLEQLDTDHIEQLTNEEKEIRFKFMQTWISETIETIKKLDPEKFAGGISYLLLALIYRIDFLIMPEGTVMNELERIQSIYFKKEILSPVEKNRQMLAGIEKLSAITSEEFYKYLFRSTSTFSIRHPKNFATIIESINVANKSTGWYKDNKFPDIARQISEYGLSSCQYLYSLPKPLTEYFQLLMEINYSAYFTALGFPIVLYDPETNSFKHEEIEFAIESITSRWKKKYPALSFNTNKLKFENIVNFNLSFTGAITELNFEGDI